MSRKQEPNLHIEWSPDGVTAVDVATGARASGANLAAIRPSIGQHRLALVGISRHIVFLKTARFPKAAPEDLQMLIAVQLGGLFPIPAGQLTFDALQTEDQNPEGFLTVVAAVRTEDLKRLKVELGQIGLKASRILPVAFGACGVAERLGGNALYLEHSGAGLALDVVQNGILRLSRTVSAASDPLCEAQRTLVAARAGSLPYVATKEVDLPEAQRADGDALTHLNAAPAFHFEMAEERIHAQKRRTASRMRQAGLLFCASILLAVLLWSDRGDAAAIVTRSEGTWTREMNRLRSIRDAKTKDSQFRSAIAGTLRRAFDTPQPLSDVVAVVGDSMPEGVWMTGLNLERGKMVQVRGIAKTAGEVAQLVEKLGTLPRFRDVRLVFANSAKIDDQPVVQFSVTARAVGNLPVPTQERKTRAKKPASAEKAGGN